jgi:hypothetical protein
MRVSVLILYVFVFYIGILLVLIYLFDRTLPLFLVWVSR